MRILGVDPGLERVGYAVLDRVRPGKVAVVAYGLIETPRIALPDRLVLIRNAIDAIISRDRPAQLATERLFFARNVTTALDVSKALGVILATGAQHGLTWHEYTAPQVKLALTGQGKAEKSQVAYMVTRLLGLSEVPKPDDVADALAVAMAHAMISPG